MFVNFKELYKQTEIFFSMRNEKENESNLSTALILFKKKHYLPYLCNCISLYQKDDFDTNNFLVLQGIFN